MVDETDSAGAESQLVPKNNSPKEASTSSPSLPTAVQSVSAPNGKKRPLEDAESSGVVEKELRTTSPERQPEAIEKNGEKNSSLNSDGEEATFTLDEFIAMHDAAEDEDDERADVAAVLGDCSDTECSYKEGYKKRQALYSCKTCYEKSKEVAGICLACTYHCHEGHTFVEMYTKRNFRCDCGNSKFSGLACKLTPNKDILNDLNKYDQNFDNKYCVCHRPHPDPEREELVQVQCVLCEDWFHLEHQLSLKKEEIEAQLDDETRSLVCKECRQKHPFTNYYIAEEGDMDFEFDKEIHKVDGCSLAFLKEKFPNLSEVTEGGWTAMEWHENVCRCEKCVEMYKSESVEFLLDPEDSFDLYSARGMAKTEADRENEVEVAINQIMNQLPRVAQIEFASALTEMRNNLREEIARIGSSGQVITETAVLEFFQRESEKMKRRREAMLNGRLDPSSDNNNNNGSL